MTKREFGKNDQSQNAGASGFALRAFLSHSDLVIRHSSRQLAMGLMRTIQAICLIACAAASIAPAPAAQSPARPPGYKLLYQQDFEKPGALNDFVFTD